MATMNVTTSANSTKSAICNSPPHHTVRQSGDRARIELKRTDVQCSDARCFFWNFKRDERVKRQTLKNSLYFRTPSTMNSGSSFLIPLKYCIAMNEIKALNIDRKNPMQRAKKPQPLNLSALSGSSTTRPTNWKPLMKIPKLKRFP